MKILSLINFFMISMTLGGIVYYERESHKDRGKQLSHYVEYVDGEKGFSKKDISDFVQRAQLDSAQAKDAYREIPVDSLRDFSKYFNNFFGSDYIRFDDRPDLSGARSYNDETTCGTLAWQYYSGYDQQRARLKTLRDSLEIKRKNDAYNAQLLQQRMEQCLQKIIVFPGSRNDYSRLRGYTVKPIPLPGNIQSIYVSLDDSDAPRTRINESDSMKAYLYRQGIEAIVYAQQIHSYHAWFRGLPVARDTSYKKK